MSKNLPWVAVGVLVAFLTGCASAEWNAARQNCRAIWFERIPPNYQQITVQRTRTVEVPDGNIRCSSDAYGNTTTSSCTQGTRTMYIPYTATETIDTNKKRRNAQIMNCTTITCMDTYGNADCEAPE